MSTRSTYTHVSVRRDASGELISVRPDQLLVPVDPQNPDSAVEILQKITDAVVRACVRPGPAPRTNIIRLLKNETWAHVRIENISPADYEILDVIAALRADGVSVQPDHVYFVTASASGGVFNPNTFTPNTFTPNTFTPNTFTPNTFTPNTFTPNTFTANAFTPNTFTAGVLGGAGMCCGRCDEPDSNVLDVPQLAARPIPEPLRRGALPIDEMRDEHHKPVVQRVEVHIIDIASPGNVGGEFTGEFNVTPYPDPAAVDENTDGYADPAVAHGYFIQSIIGLEGGLDSTLWQAADALGEISDGDLVDALEDVIAASSKDGTIRVLNLSLSGYHTGLDPDEPLLRTTIREMLDDDWVIVAAAGNNADCRPAMPAAIDGVIAVGAVSPCGPAWFSNYGWWVDVSAPGVNVIAEWPTLDPGAGTPQNPESGSDMAVHGHLIVGNGQDPHHLEDIRPLCLADFNTGWAFWSGTSFSTPFVVARIARTIHDLIVDGAPTGTAAERQRVIDEAIHHSIYRDDIPWFPNYGRILT